MAFENKNLIIHFQPNNEQTIKYALNNTQYEKYYDGHECTICNDIILSKRFYYYDVPHNTLYDMLKALNSTCANFKIKILPKDYGNHNFDMHDEVYNGMLANIGKH